MVIARRQGAFALALTLFFAGQESLLSAGYIEGAAPRCPASLPAEWLAPAAHPCVTCTRDELEAARRTVRETPWGKAFLERQSRLVRRLVAMSPQQLQALVPRPKSQFVYGLGLNLDPYEGRRLLWCGWGRPFCVRDGKGRVYPNAEHPDDGGGWKDPVSGKTFYFVARANGFIVEQLDQYVLPALADVAALTGSEPHALAAAALLDALAAVYPTNRLGPLDYPVSKGDEDHGGRLDRPYYQTARGLINYVHVIDLVAPSGALNRPSLAAPGRTIREHVIRNFLWDGAAYCYNYGVGGHQLHNGHADYVRGAALVGTLLGVRELGKPMFQGPLSLDSMLAISLDRNGFYSETSPAYANHTRELYLTMAEIIEAARRRGWRDIPSAFDNPAMRLFLTDPFDRQEVGGHMPLIGDSGPLRLTLDPTRRFIKGPRAESDPYLKTQLQSAWARLVRSPDAGDRQAAARLLRSAIGAEPVVPAGDERWTIYHVTPAHVKLVEQTAADPAYFETGPVAYGAKGLALLRGGRGPRRHGAQLLFGPMHNHAHKEALTWTFFDRGTEWSFDPGYYNTHYRFGWTSTTVSHQAMVVNQTSYDPDAGAGHLLAWSDSPEAQWALAAHGLAYRAMGVTRYERLIGQTQAPGDGGLGYWLDVGLVAGGATRDDSFHAAFSEVAIDGVTLPQPDPARPALFGKKNFGAILDNNGRLRGPEFDGKPFYWAPNGDGYGFLGNPCQAVQAGAVRATFRSPAYAKDFQGSLVADLGGAPGRSLILADGPVMPGTPKMPYLLRRDRGAAPSVFVKVLRLVPAGGVDPIAAVVQPAVESGPLKSPSLAPRAVLIAWKDGRRDLWVWTDGAACTVRPDGLPAVRTDARVAMVRYGAQGKPAAVRASGASHVAVEGAADLKGFAAAEGRLDKMRVEQGRAVFSVTWEKGAAALDRMRPGAIVITRPRAGQPATWTLRAAHGGELVLDDVKTTLADVQFTAVAGKPGWYTMYPGVTRFYGPGGKANYGFAVGKAVYAGDRLVARVAQIATDARSVRLLSDAGRPADLGKTFNGTIHEAGAGDRLEIPLETCWTAP